MSKIVYKKDDIKTLIRYSQQGNIKALEELIRRVQKDIYVIFTHLTIKREDISDLTQETLLRMAKSITQLNKPENFKPWLNRIITNVFYDYNRKGEDKITEIDENILNEIKDKLGCEPGERCLFSELEKIIKAALLSLPINLRITLILREYEGLSYEDISRITNTSLGTVKSRISRARLKLQEQLKEFI